jgi:hypothetical protein
MPAASENRKRLQRELAEHLREKDRAALALLRAKITAARVERRQRLSAARQTCRGALFALRESQREERHQLTLTHRSQLEQGRATRNTGKQQARDEGLALERLAQTEYQDERRFQRQMPWATKPRVERSTVCERKQEDDDAVRNNLPLFRALHNGSYAEPLVMRSSKQDRLDFCILECRDTA